MTAYQEGIADRRLGSKKHENPYIGKRVDFTTWLLNPFSFNELHQNQTDWELGWEAENKSQLKEST